MAEPCGEEVTGLILTARAKHGTRGPKHVINWNIPPDDLKLVQMGLSFRITAEEWAEPPDDLPIRTIHEVQFT